MTPRRVLAELESLASRLGVEVRAEAFGKGLLRGKGGLCWVDGRPLVVMDETLPTPDRIVLLAGALARFDLEGEDLATFVREAIDAARAPPRRRPPRKPTRPGLARAKPRR